VPLSAVVGALQWLTRASDKFRVATHPRSPSHTTISHHLRTATRCHQQLAGTLRRSLVMHLARYATMAVGKWHLGQQPQYLPRRRGFDAFLGLPFSVDDGVGYASTCTGAHGGDDHHAHDEPSHGRPIHSGATSASAAASRASLYSRRGEEGAATAERRPSSMSPQAQRRAAASESPHSRATGRDSLHSRARLGPSLPLPLIRQYGNTSEIVEQPTDLTLLNQRLYNFTAEFATLHASEPMLLYIAFGHVHTATPNINPSTKQ
jgi:hypothetical protein